MIYNIGKVYQDGPLYKFIITNKGVSNGYKAKKEKDAIKARAKLIKELKSHGCKIHM